MWLQLSKCINRHFEGGTTEESPFRCIKLGILLLTSRDQNDELIFKLFLSIFISCLTTFVQAQSKIDSTKNKILDKTEVDFLFSYYHQEGNNSAVTGGQGTEKLTDIASIVIVNVPRKPTRTLNVEYGFSYYSSASSDNINPFTISSASSTNLVHRLMVTSIYKDTANGSQLGIRAGVTHQNNFGSVTVGGFYSHQSADKSREVKVDGGFTLDKWGLYYPISKLYPVELKGQGDLVDTDKRYSYNLSFAYKQIFTKRMQMQFSWEVIYQTGLLSTPFHRVYFVEQSQAELEKLPSHRFRIPLTMRLNYFVFDRLIIRSWYRYYYDDFGISAHTINLELPFKITNFFSVYPFYNYHTQSSANYFRGYKEHVLSESYYTSDYDLFNLNSYELGAGFYYSPVSYMATFRHKKKGTYFALKKWETRYAYYKRSTGLHANIISTQLGFVF